MFSWNMCFYVYVCVLYLWLHINIIVCCVFCGCMCFVYVVCVVCVFGGMDSPPIIGVCTALVLGEAGPRTSDRGPALRSSERCGDKAGTLAHVLQPPGEGLRTEGLRGPGGGVGGRLRASIPSRVQAKVRRGPVRGVCFLLERQDNEASGFTSRCDY